MGWPTHRLPTPSGLTVFGQGGIFPVDLQVAGVIEALVPPKDRQKRGENSKIVTEKWKVTVLEGRVRWQ